MAADPDTRYRQERDQTFDGILAVIARHLEAVPAIFSLDIHALSPSAAQAGATREAWTLLQAGVRHLKNGAPEGAAGSLPGALEKTSIRASGLAAAIGVRPPRFEETFYFGSHGSGRDEALFITKRLIEAAAGDLAHSRQIIGAQLSLSDPAAAFGEMPKVSDPALKAIFDAVKVSNPGHPAIAAEDLAAMRKQSVLSLNALVTAYGEAGQALKRQLDALPEFPPASKPAPKAQSFDL